MNFVGQSVWAKLFLPKAAFNRRKCQGSQLGVSHNNTIDHVVGCCFGKKVITHQSSDDGGRPAAGVISDDPHLQ